MLCRYVHAGAWRNPHQDSRGFQAAIAQLLDAKDANDSQLDRIAGFAAMNYRLSPNPESPTPDDPATWARHPDHLDDVLAALHYLYLNHDLDRSLGYVLAGASAGATIAFQAARSFGSPTGRPSNIQIPPPLALAGIGGVYDIPLFSKTSGLPLFHGIVEGAFGEDQVVWKDASPATAPADEDYTRLFHPKTQLVMVAQSTEDEVIETKQRDVMLSELKTWVNRGDSEGADVKCIHKDALEREVWQSIDTGGGVGDRTLISRDLTGLHEDLWEKPAQMVECLEDILRTVFLAHPPPVTNGISNSL